MRISNGTMKVARLYRFDDIRIEETLVPEVGPGDALIRTKACGICSGDVMPWYIERKAPLVLGHEPVGEIVTFGTNASPSSERPTGFAVGDRVFVHHHAPCLACRRCRRGDFVQCDIWRSSKILPGGIAEYILIPEINLRHDTRRLPETVSYEDGTLIEPTACSLKALRRSSLRQGDTVLVIGLGVMGQINALLARQFGAGVIIGTDLVPYRLLRAKELGMDFIIDASQGSIVDAVKEITDGAMAETVIVGPNSIAAIQQGLSSVAPGGTVVLFTPSRPGERLTLNPNELYFRDVNVVTSYSCGPDDTQEALQYIGKRTVTAEMLVTHRFSIDETAEAFRVTAKAKNSLKCIVVF